MEKVTAKVYPALKEHIDIGGIWHNFEKLPARCTIKLVYKNKTIYCESLYIDDNFIRLYNKDPRQFIDKNTKSIVISEWYRLKLGISKHHEYGFEYRKNRNLINNIKASLTHPQLAIRISVWLGIVSVILGMVGVVLGAMPLILKVL